MRSTSRLIALAALIAMWATLAMAANGVCPNNIPAVQASFPQSFNGANTMFDWTISLTQTVNDPPAGDTTCGMAAYISQYTPKGACSSSPSTLDGNPSPIENGCSFNFQDAMRKMGVSVTCDPKAQSLTMGSSVAVTEDATNIFHYVFTATYAGVCSGGPTNGPTNGPTDGPNGGGGGGSPACGGGCAFTIIFFVGGGLYVIGTVAWNYFKAGKRGKELAPHPEFWLMIPGLIKDGAIFSFQMVTKPCRKDGGGGGSSYTQV